MEYPFSLQKYNGKGTRFECPDCKKPSTFSRYINNATKEALHPEVGRCNREVECTYHMTPKQYFAKNNIPYKANFKKSFRVNPIKPKPAKPFPEIPFEILESSLQGYEYNVFAQYLVKLFGPETAKQALLQYKVGTSNECYRPETGNWQGASVFWFIDINGRVRTGQVKLFDKIGHTAKFKTKKGEFKTCTDWVHNALKQKYNKSATPWPAWLRDYMEGEKVSCMFGEHLLRDSSKPIAVVEAPKTAIIASVYLPDFTWVAVGALSYLNEKRCKALAGREVVFFPDLNGYDKWKARTAELKYLARFEVSALLEHHATDDERRKGLDLADYLVRFKLNDFQKLPEEPEVVQVPTITKASDLAPVPDLQPVPVLIAIEPAEPFSDNLHNRIEALQSFYNNAILPTWPIKITAGCTISNLPKFVNSHLHIVEANKGKRIIMPYLDRLEHLKTILS